ncbi:MAG: hypothetical protein QM786_02775 [Breznakibacter sp.]
MKTIVLIIVFFGGIVTAVGQERYYFKIPTKAKARYEIDLKNSNIYNTDTINFKIESLTLLKPEKSWRNDNLRLIAVNGNMIYTKDSKGVNLYLFDINGNPIRKIDLSKFDKHFKITDSEIYNDTLYLVDNESLFLFKFSSVGDLIAKETLTFNFEDFNINKQGIFFISKHLDEKKEKGVRIGLFDFSLDLLKLYFVTDRQNVTELRPKFFKGEGDETLFSITACNQIYNLEKDRVSLYLETYTGSYIGDYTYGLGFHFLKEAFPVKGQPYFDVITYYFPKEKLKDGIRFQSYSPYDLAVLLFNGSKIYKETYINITDMMEVQIPKILEMKWAKDHKYIKEKLLGLIKQVDEINKFVVTRYKVIENPDVVN